MRKFDVIFRDIRKKRKKTLSYDNLSGKQAIKIMEDLEKKGFETKALTESVFAGWEILTLNEMKEVVL